MSQPQGYLRPLPPEPLPPPIPSTPLGCCRALGWSPWVTQQIPPGSVSCTWQCVCFRDPLSVPPILSFPHCVHKWVLYVCISTATLQIGSSVPSFYFPYTCLNTQYSSFPFWLTSVSTVGSRFIHLDELEWIKFILTWFSPWSTATCTFSSVQSLSRVWLFETPWTTARQASLSITTSQSLPKPMFIESEMPANHLTLCRPLHLLPSIFPSIRVFPNESALRIRWPKYWSFSFGISPSSEHSGLISFRMDWMDLLAVQGTL